MEQNEPSPLLETVDAARAEVQFVDTLYHEHSFTNLDHDRPVSLSQRQYQWEMSKEEWSQPPKNRWQSLGDAFLQHKNVPASNFQIEICSLLEKFGKNRPDSLEASRRALKIFMKNFENVRYAMQLLLASDQVVPLPSNLIFRVDQMKGEEIGWISKMTGETMGRTVTPAKYKEFYSGQYYCSTLRLPNASARYDLVTQCVMDQRLKLSECTRTIKDLSGYGNPEIVEAFVSKVLLPACGRDTNISHELILEPHLVKEAQEVAQMDFGSHKR